MRMNQTHASLWNRKLEQYSLIACNTHLIIHLGLIVPIIKMSKYIIPILCSFCNRKFNVEIDNRGNICLIVVWKVIGTPDFWGYFLLYSRATSQLDIVHPP